MMRILGAEFRRFLVLLLFWFDLSVFAININSTHSGAKGGKGQKKK